jgi:acyl carrier protein
MPDTLLVTRIGDFIAHTFPLARGVQLDSHAPLLTSGIVDSLGVLAIIGFVQREFGVELLDEELTAENFESIASLAELVAGKRDALTVGGHDAGSLTS